MADDDEAAVLSDVDDADDPSPVLLPPKPASAALSPSASASASASSDQRIRELLAELDEERRARKFADEARADAESRLHRLKAFAQEVIRKRDDTLRLKEEAVRLKDETLRLKDEAFAQRDSLQSEFSMATQMLNSGMDKISGKISAFKTFPPADGLPKSQKYSGLPSIAYGVIKRTNEIVEELLRQIESATKSRDQAREHMEQRNYEIAIEVSELEAKISSLQDEVSKKQGENEKLIDTVAQMEREISELKRFGEDCDAKAKGLEAKLDSQRPVLLEQLNFISRVYEEMLELTKLLDSDQSDSSDSLFMWKEMDIDENLKVLLEGTKSAYELAMLTKEKVRERMEERNGEVKSLSEKVESLIGEKQHIGTLLRSLLLSNNSEVLQVAEDGLREAGIELRLDCTNKHDLGNGNDDEVYTLAGALENTVKESQIKIIELQHLVEALRAESSLLRGRLDSQEKEISQCKKYIKELEEKERVANESVEGLMMDIAVAEEEIARWKVAAEQEAAAGSSVEQEFQTQILSLKKELEEGKQAIAELESKLKSKEEIAATAMAARDAAEKSLRLADLRSSRLRQRIEELTRQIEQSDGQDESTSRNSHRYMCWPWQWLGLNYIRYSQIEEPLISNEMELSEPLI